LGRVLSCSVELLDAEFLRTNGGLMDRCAFKTAVLLPRRFQRSFTLARCTILAALRREHTRDKGLVVGITLLGCLALCIDLQAQAGGDTEQQIKQLQQEVIDAQMKNGVSWAEQHLAEGFMAGHSWGEWQTKADFIKDLQNKSNKVEEWQH
jgi:hypothetical protein